MKQGINLRAYAQKDPLNEYKREAFLLFDGMLTNLRETTTAVLSHLEIQLDGGVEEQTAGEQAAEAPMAAPPPAADPRATQAAAVIDPADPSTWGKVPRNSPCPCGSGKKYKHCHGRVQ